MYWCCCSCLKVGPVPGTSDQDQSPARGRLPRSYLSAQSSVQVPPSPTLDSYLRTLYSVLLTRCLFWVSKSSGLKGLVALLCALCACTWFPNTVGVVFPLFFFLPPTHCCLLVSLSLTYHYDIKTRYQAQIQQYRLWKMLLGSGVFEYMVRCVTLTEWCSCGERACRRSTRKRRSHWQTPPNTRTCSLGWRRLSWPSSTSERPVWARADLPPTTLWSRWERLTPPFRPIRIELGVE